MLYVRVPVTQSVGVLPRTALRSFRSRWMVRAFASAPGKAPAEALATPLPTVGAIGSPVAAIVAARFGLSMNVRRTPWVEPRSAVLSV